MATHDKRIAALERASGAGKNFKVIFAMTGETFREAKEREGVKDGENVLVVSFGPQGDKGEQHHAKP